MAIVRDDKTSEGGKVERTHYCEGVVFNAVQPTTSKTVPKQDDKQERDDGIAEVDSRGGCLDGPYITHCNRRIYYDNSSHSNKCKDDSRDVLHHDRVSFR